MLEIIDSYIEPLLEGKKISCSVRIAPEMYDVIMKDAKAEYLDMTEYIRAVLALHVMPEIIERELKKEAGADIIRDGKDALKLHFSDKLLKFKVLRKLTELAEEKTYNLYQKFFKLEEECLDEIKAEVSKELGE